MDIYQKLSAIQQELKAPKSQYNSFGKYHYRKCEDILEAVKPLLAKYKCVLTMDDTIVQVGDRYYLKTLALLTDYEASGHISTTALAREEEHKSGMDGSQITGASSSYARKYALNGLFCIDDTADSDTTNVGEEKPQNRTQKGGRQSAPSNPQKPVESKVKQLSADKYWELVGKYGSGQQGDKGEDLREWYFNYINATPEQVARFDADVDNWRAANL